MVKSNVCITCPNHCCRHPMMANSEVEVMANFLDVPIEEIPVKRVDENFVQMDNPNNNRQCFAFEPGRGCKLPHSLKPIICQLYPFIPHKFENSSGTEWELLLDVGLCHGWKVFGKIYPKAKAHFDLLRARNEHWIEETPEVQE